jgi:hypothetical protein
MKPHEIKKFLYTKEKKMITRLKKVLTEWEKIFNTYTSDKGLITKIYREFKKLNSTKNQ